jgi:hypothetical protein
MGKSRAVQNEKSSDKSYEHTAAYAAGRKNARHARANIAVMLES